MKAKWLTAIGVGVLAVLMGAYHLLDNETSVLNQTERERLGGSYVQLSDGVTHYELAGPANGRLVVMVHGGTVPMWGWDNQFNALVGAGYRVLRYDHFGRGYSDRPGIAYGRALYARQLIELVDHLELTGAFDLVGVSFGAATSVNVAANNPGRIRSLSLISPVVSNFDVPGVFRIPVLGEIMARLIGVDIIVKRFARLVEGNSDAARYEALFAEQTTYAGFQRALLSFLRGDALRDYTSEYQTVGRQGTGTLLIWGTDDDEISREMINAAQSYIPHLSFKPINEAGHGVAMQQPRVVTELLLAFLSRENIAAQSR